MLHACAAARPWPPSSGRRLGGGSQPHTAAARARGLRASSRAPVVAALDLDRGIAAEPLVPKPASLQFAAALSEVAIAGFAAPAIAAGLEWVPYDGGRWRCPPRPANKQPTFGDVLDRGWNNIGVSYW